MTAIPAPASSTARGLNFPRRPATAEGSPNTPLPMMEFTTNAVRLQRPMTRIRCWFDDCWFDERWLDECWLDESWLDGLSALSGTPCFITHGG